MGYRVGNKKQKPSASEALKASVGTNFHEISPLPTEQGAVLLRLILDTIFFPHLLERSPKFGQLLVRVKPVMN
ncbi:hypothetical protein MiSe_56880 [Microseira wollei NIES-4236]|uniref:Transposase n=1 Tax=Microseira wollei NIES-4236 TaxID=2530354 RepID=A0AAV3XHE6_9CYAN|nr:hypothetical protein MiSe_56880 [Microseira wollei NIES-4236]